MAALEEFELAGPDCDGPGLYAIQDGHRLRAGVTSNLSRFARRQRTPVRILSVAHLEPGEAPHTCRSLLRSLRGLTPKECQFEAGVARDVTHGMLEVARGSVLIASEIHRRVASEIHRRAQRFRSPVRGESVASTRLESSDSGHRPRPSQEHPPPTFRRLLNEIGADD